MRTYFGAVKRVVYADCDEAYRRNHFAHTPHGHSREMASHGEYKRNGPFVCVVYCCHLEVIYVYGFLLYFCDIFKKNFNVDDYFNHKFMVFYRLKDQHFIYI